MEQLELLWIYQQADSAADKLENEIKRSPTRQKLVKYRDSLLEQQTAFKHVESEVAAMGDVIQYVPATPAFDDEAAEEASLLQTALADAFFVWDDAFMRGTKDIDADWAEYEADLKDKGIDEFVDLYNQYNKYK